MTETVGPELKQGLGGRTGLTLMQSLANLTHLIIDMDGVLYVGDRPMRCLREFFSLHPGNE
jgi:hypothetical protein